MATSEDITVHLSLQRDPLRLFQIIWLLGMIDDPGGIAQRIADMKAQDNLGSFAGSYSIGCRFVDTGDDRHGLAASSAGRMQWSHRWTDFP